MFDQALIELELGIGDEAHLDEGSHTPTDRLPSYARDAVNHYMEGCSKLMGLLPALNELSTTKKLVYDTVTYYMNRVSILNAFIEALALEDAVSSDSEDERELKHWRCK